MPDEGATARAPGDPAAPPPGEPGAQLPVPRRLLVAEVWLLFGVSLGASGATALVSLMGNLTAGRSLQTQTALINGTRAPGRPWLDLAFQLLALTLAFVPVLLADHFLIRSGESMADIGVTRRVPARDVALGLALAALVGGTGLFLYLGARGAGANLTVVPENLPDVWWRIPVLLLAAVKDGVVEEVLVVGYLLHRLRQFGWGDNRALVTSALVRGSYHLYQGIGGFAGNAVMGLLFGRIYQRTGRTMPLVIAHVTIDAVAFVGYALLAGKVSWLPIP
jgi:membrane protease YdiL (CAAX protease family)